MIELINNEVFQFKTILVYETTRDKMRKAIIKLDLPHQVLDKVSDNCVDWFMWYDQETDCSFVFLYDKDLQVIIHESLHLTTRLCDSKWLQIGIENDEVLTYIQWWYIKMICSILKIKY